MVWSTWFESQLLLQGIIRSYRDEYAFPSVGKCISFTNVVYSKGPHSRQVKIFNQFVYLQGFNQDRLHIKTYRNATAWRHCHRISLERCPLLTFVTLAAQWSSAGVPWSQLLLTARFVRTNTIHGQQRDITSRRPVWDKSVLGCSRAACLHGRTSQSP